MASFSEKLKSVLDDATSQGVLPPDSAARLLDFASQRDSQRHVSIVAAILGTLGAAVVAVGISLLVAANWEDIPGWTKVLGFLILLSAVYGAGLWIEWTGKPYPRIAHSLYFLGALMFLAGVGLIAQVYNLHDRPANGILLWLVAILPILLIHRSAPIAGVWIVGFVVWMHIETASEGSWIPLWDVFSLHLFLEIALGIALIGFASLIARWESSVATVASLLGLVMVAGPLYLLGFFRHWGDWHGYWRHGSEMTWNHILLPAALLALALSGLVQMWHSPNPRSARLRLFLMASLGLLLVAAVCSVLVEVNVIPEGDVVKLWEFGWSRDVHVNAVLATAFAWIAWFALSAWCLAWGASECRKGFINLGVIGIGVGVITRFFDLAYNLATTGWIFVAGGVVMGLTAWLMERWRRRLVAHVEARP